MALPEGKSVADMANEARVDRARKIVQGFEDVVAAATAKATLPANATKKATDAVSAAADEARANLIRLLSE
jgi:hypothetical protein